MKKQILTGFILLGTWTFASATLFIQGATGQSGTSAGALQSSTIYDGNPAYVIGNSMNLSAAGLGFSLSSLTVTANITGGENNGLYGYLVDPNGTVVTLMNQPGVAVNGFGATGAGMNITLQDVGAASGSIQNAISAAVLSGTYQADGSLSGCNGDNPNGDWTLYFADTIGGGGNATLNGWSLNIITAVPEPVNVAVAILSLGFVGFRVLRNYRTSKKLGSISLKMSPEAARRTSWRLWFAVTKTGSWVPVWGGWRRFWVGAATQFSDQMKCALANLDLLLPVQRNKMLLVNQMHWLKTCASVCMLAFALKAAAQTNIAQNNFIQNGGFDNGSTGWSTSAGGAVFYSQPVGSETDSILSIGWSNGNSFSQNTGATFQPGMDYVLTIRADVGQSPLTGVNLSLQATNTSLVTLTNQSFAFPNQSTNTWRIFSLYVSSNTIASNVGNIMVVKGSLVENPTSQQGWLWVDWLQLAPALPYFTSQPAGVTNTAGSSVSLSAVAIGAVTNSSGPGSAMLYQWYQNGSPLVNATNPTLTFAALNSTNAGNYAVVATGPYGATRSASATVALTPGFVVNNGAPQTGAVVGRASGSPDTVSASGTFTGSYSQNTANGYATELVAINTNTVITLPNPGGVVNAWTQNSGNTYTNFYNGLIEISQGGFTNFGTINAAFSSLPASTGPLQGLDPYVSGSAPSNYTPTNSYYYGIGLLAWCGNVGYSTRSTIYNNAGATIKSSVTGSGVSYAYGIDSLQYYGDASKPNITINNLGTVDGEVTNYDGTASGILPLQSLWRIEFDQWRQRRLQRSRALLWRAGITASSYYGPVNLENDGTATGFATGATSDWVAGHAYSVGIDVFTYDGSSNAPISVVNTGTASGLNPGSIPTNGCHGIFLWAEGGPMTLNNSGMISANSTTNSAVNTVAWAKPVYCGGNRGPDLVINSGTITGTAGGGGGWGLGVENDTSVPNDPFNTITILNTGTIYHNNGLGVAVFAGTGPAIISNSVSGSIYGGNEGIAAENYPGNVTIYDYGSIQSGGPGNNAMDLGPGNDTVHLYGLPNIVGWMNGQGGSNVLDFELTGVLQLVNGSPATLGNNLSAYSLGTSGNITVSGQNYEWHNFNVTGTITSTGGVGPVV